MSNANNSIKHINNMLTLLQSKRYLNKEYKDE